MEQLIKITCIPIQYQLKTQNARLEYSPSSASLKIGRNKGGMTMHRRSAKLNLDSFEARNSVVPTTARSIRQLAQKGLAAAWEAAAQLAKEGQFMLKAKPGEDVLGQIFSQRAQQPTGEFSLGFTPSAPVELSYEPGELIMNYQMDKLFFDMNIENGNIEFIPSVFECSIEQYPDVKLEYVGGPSYVPPSSDPNFEPLDVRA